MQRAWTWDISSGAEEMSLRGVNNEHWVDAQFELRLAQSGSGDLRSADSLDDRIHKIVSTTKDP